MDERYSIDTPEQISFDYDIAGIGSRFLAALIDVALLLLVLGTINTLAGIAANAFSERLALANSVVAAFFTLLNFAFTWGYFLFFELAWNGQTPGKRLVGLRVVQDGGRPLGFSGAALRNLLRIIDFLPLFYGIGVVTMFIDSRSRRLGDLAAGTLVVKSRHSASLDELTAATPPPFVTNSVPQATLPNVGLLDGADYAVLQEYLRRRSDLPPDARRRLAAQLAARLRSRMAFEGTLDDEQLIDRAAAEYAASK